MQVIEPSQGVSGQRPFRAGLFPLLRDVGTENFDATLHSTVGRILGCEHVTAFAFREGSAPRIVTIAAGVGTDVARDAAKKYLALHWRDDPSNIFSNVDFEQNKICIVFLSQEDVFNRRYRKDCYIDTHIRHRASIIRKFDQEYLKISFHRAESSGPFRPDALFDLTEQVDLLGSLLLKHSQGPRERTAVVASVETFERKLELSRPQLTARERKVCSLIAAGMSSEAIALTLGISINTVLTFRRRAYARLNISSQNELMRIVYS